MVVKNDHGPVALVAIILITIVCLFGGLLSNAEILNPTRAEIEKAQFELQAQPTREALEAARAARIAENRERQLEQAGALVNLLLKVVLASAAMVLALGGFTYLIGLNANHLRDPELDRPLAVTGAAPSPRQPARLTRLNRQPPPRRGGSNGKIHATQEWKNTERFTKIEHGAK